MNSAATIDYQQDAIKVNGELNFTTVVTLLRDSLPKLGGYTSLHFDLSKVSAGDSGGVALILEWIKYAKQYSKPIQFTNIPPHLSSILSVSGVSSMLNN